MLLSEIAPYAPKFDSGFVVDYWNQEVQTVEGKAFAM